MNPSNNTNIVNGNGPNNNNPANNNQFVPQNYSGFGTSLGLNSLSPFNSSTQPPVQTNSPGLNSNQQTNSFEGNQYSLNNLNNLSNLNTNLNPFNLSLLNLPNSPNQPSPQPTQPY